MLYGFFRSSEYQQKHPVFAHSVISLNSWLRFCSITNDINCIDNSLRFCSITTKPNGINYIDCNLLTVIRERVYEL